MIGVESSLFCENCGNLLNFDYKMDRHLTCNTCKFENKRLNNENNFSVSVSKYNFSSIWKNKLHNEIDNFKVFQEGGNKILVVQDCPNCESKEMIQYAMQMRSADEGSTVFIECQKCGYKSTVNN